MRLLTSEEMRRIDAWAKKKLGVSGVVLMENAGRGCVDVLREYFPLRGLKVMIVCGKGNNGGDGLVMARHLINEGSRVETLLLGRAKELKGEALANYRVLKASSVTVRETRSVRAFRKVMAGFGPDCIVDAVFGTGFKGAPKGIYPDVFKAINAGNGFVLSVDIPSGIDGDTGIFEKICVHADATVAMCLPKRGNYLYPGRKFQGNLHVVDIGIPMSAISDGYPRVVEYEDVFKIMPARPPDGNKGTFGSVLVIAGARGFSGAAAMTALSALKIGAGYVRLAAPEGILPALEARLLEVVKIPLPQTGEMTISSRGVDMVAPALDKADAVIIGPGITTHPDTAKFLKTLLPLVKVPLLIDADALNIIALNARFLGKIRAPFVMTPHPGELSRLIKLSSQAINRDRVDCAAKCARRFGCVMVLKGAPTVVASPDGKVFVNPTGNSGLAKAGTGDVLAGMIGSLCAQKTAPLEAAIAGVFLHGLSADLAIEKKDEYSLMAGDLIKQLPRTIRYVMTREYEELET